MTLIAYKDGILCADSQRLCDGIRSKTLVVKIARNIRGELFAAAGYAAVSQTWMNWFLGGCEHDAPWRDAQSDNPDSIVIILDNGSSRRYVGRPEIPEYMPYERLGIGWPSYLHGLMDGGLSAREAIFAGIENYVNADYPVIEVGHFGPAIIWESRSDTMAPEAFERKIGARLGSYFGGV